MNGILVDHAAGHQTSRHMENPSILLIEGSDFETFPTGGQLSMVRALLKLFGNRLALVGMNRGNEPTGQWIRKNIGGSSYYFLSVARIEPTGERPLIPVRFTFYRALRRYKRSILSLGCRAAFIQAPDALLAMSRWNWETLCFWFPGVENQLKASRYRFARPLAPLFDRALFSALDRAEVILAAADENSINALVARSNGRLARKRLINFPTCVDTSLFYPIPTRKARAELGIEEDNVVFVTTGRIGRLKGWELLLDAFEQFLLRNQDATLFFVGDGEDRSLLQAQIERRTLQSNVKITGFQNPSQVASYLNAADVVLSGSLLEGWSVAMLEALACGKRIVSTVVSGAAAMIKSGQNGFIVTDRDPVRYAEAMQAALNLNGAEQVSLSIASEFDLARLRDRLANVWAPFRQDEHSPIQMQSETAEVDLATSSSSKRTATPGGRLPASDI